MIGRSHEWSDEQHKALHGLNRRLSDISVITYDHLLAQARRTLELMESDDEPEIETPAYSTYADDWGPDEAPF